MSRFGLVMCGAVLLPLVLAVGCSDSERSKGDPQAVTATTTVDEAFRARAEKVCTPYATYNNRHFFKTKGFNRYAPDAASLPRVGAYIGRNPSYRTLASELEALGEPASGRETWDSLLTDVRDGQRWAASEARSGRQRNVTMFTKAADELEKSNSALSADLAKAGLTGKSPCLKAQINPLQVRPGEATVG